MKFLDKLEQKLSFIGIENLMLHISLITAIMYVLEHFLGFPMSYLLCMNASNVLNGEFWRLITFIFVPPTSSLIFIAIALYFYYMIGSALENRWGKTKFTIYYITSMIGTIIASFITQSPMTGYYINLSMFLAFAFIYPDLEILLFFIIPCKVKYIAYVDGIFLVYSFIIGNLAAKAAIIAALVAFFLFFGGNIISGIKSYIRRENYKRKIK